MAEEMSERDRVILDLVRERARYGHPANNTKYAIYRALEYIVAHLPAEEKSDD